MLRELLTEQAVDHGFTALLAGSVTAATLEYRHAHGLSGEADQRGAKNNNRKRDIEKEDSDEGRRCEPDQSLVLEGALTDPDHSLDDNCQDGGLEAEEQRRDDRNVAPARVDVAEGHDGDDAGHDKEATRHDAPKRAMHQPADVGGKLLRLGPRQQQEIVEPVQKALFGNPPFLLDKDAMHCRDLAGGTAKAERRDAHPCPEGLAHAYAMRGHVGDGAGHSRIVHLRPLVWRWASCGSPRWRRDTSDRKHRKIPWPHRAEEGRPDTCANSRAMRRAALPIAA